MISSIVSRLVILVFGTLYPAYASYKAVRTKNVREYVKWMMYWIVFALFSCAETFTDVFLSFWFPFYYEIKILLVLWLLSPATKGSSILYRKFVHPMLSRREQDIDEYIAKAKEQGYHTVLHLGTKGVNYATTVIMQTAIKGGGGLVQQLRRSYSLGDLSSDVDGDSNSGRKALPEAQDRNRDRERVASGGDGRHHRPRGHSPRRSASGSGRVEMYFPEVDVDVRGASVREPSVPLSHIRSSEDVSSGYSSAEPLYQHGGSVGGGQHGESRPDSLASSREPLVRTASVGGSSRSTRTRSSRGGGGTVAKKGSSPGVPEGSEECSIGENADLDMNSPSPSHSRSRSNSLPMSADLLRPELVALLQALNAELEQKVSMSKLSEIKISEASEQMEKPEDSFHLAEGEVMESIHRTESSSILELAGTKETSEIKVSESSHPNLPAINPAVDSDDDFFDSVTVPPPSVLNECEFEDAKGEIIDSYPKTANEPEKVNICLDQERIDNGSTSTFTSSSLSSSEKFLNVSEQHKMGTENDDNLLVNSVGISYVGASKEIQSLIPTPQENVKTEIPFLPVDVNSQLSPETFAPAISEAPEGGNASNKVMNSTETSKQLEEMNNALQREENCLGDVLKIDQSLGDADKTAYNDRKTSETINVSVVNPTETTQLEEINNALQRKETCINGILETNQSLGDADKTACNDATASEKDNVSKKNDDNCASEQILSSAKAEMDGPNNIVGTEQDQIVGDEFQDASDGKDMKTKNSISNDMSSQKQTSLPASSYGVADNTQHAVISTVEKPCLEVDSSDNKDMKAENSIFLDIADHKLSILPATPQAALDNSQNTTISSADNPSLKVDRVEKVFDTEIVPHKSDGICDSEISLNYDLHNPTNSNSHPDTKKDIRSGRYHKLQAPEPPPRSKRSSSKGSISDENEKKSEHRSRSPTKVVESPVAKLHGQIENLTSMLPFWHSGKRSRGKEIGTADGGIRIREMSRSPSRRVGRQAPH